MRRPRQRSEAQPHCPHPRGGQPAPARPRPDPPRLR